MTTEPFVPPPGVRGIVLPFGNVWPTLSPDVYVAETATVIGDVVIGAGSSLWFGVVVRGDVNEIRIGAGTNIQDGTVIHVSRDGNGTYLGDHVTVGHMAMLHACTVGDGAFIGMKACLLDGVVVEPGGMVAAGALVTPGKRVAAGELWSGAPARLMRRLSADEQAYYAKTAPHYAMLARRYAEGARAAATSP